MNIFKHPKTVACLLLPAAFHPGLLYAQDGVNGANTAWILTSTALVLFMTLPGLALFYAGLVQAKNVLSKAKANSVIRTVVSGRRRASGRILTRCGPGPGVSAGPASTL